MDTATSRLFDGDYYAHGCGLPYERNEGWLAFFDRIADRIASDLQPHSALDAGCALGMLVEGLRRRDIDAHGIDVSSFAIEHADVSVRPYLRQASITDPLEGHYDLITCIEALEHMPADEGERAVEILCQHADDVLFSSSPLDYREATHFNVRPPDYWVAQFARHGFFHDVDFDASFITPWTMRFRRLNGQVSSVVAAYERRLWQLAQENHARRELAIDQRRELVQSQQRAQELQAAATLHEQQLDALRQHLEQQVADQRQACEEQLLALRTESQQAIGERDARLSELERNLDAWRSRQEQIERTLAWSVLRRLQRLRALVAPPASVRDRIIERLLRARRRDSNSPPEGRVLNRKP